MTTLTNPSKEEQARLRQEWATPGDFFSVVDKEFKFQLDAAATAENAKCEKFITPEMDALDPDTEWVSRKERGIHRVWVNPGFAKPDLWMPRAHDEAQKHPSAVVVVMGLISPPANWWRDWAMLASEIRFLGAKSRCTRKGKRGGERVQFVAPKGIKQTTNARENCLIIFRPNPYGREPDIWTWDWTEGLK